MNELMVNTNEFANYEDTVEAGENENRNESNKLVDFQSFLQSPYNGKLSGPASPFARVKRDKPESRPWDGGNWETPFLPNLTTHHDDDDDDDDEHAKTLSAQMSGLLDSPREATKVHSAGNNNTLKTEDSTVDKRANSSNTGRATASSIKSPDAGTGSSIESQDRKGDSDRIPAWSRFPVSGQQQRHQSFAGADHLHYESHQHQHQHQQHHGHGHRGSHDSGDPHDASTGMGGMASPTSPDDLSSDMAALDMSGPGPVHLRRAQSAELVRRAFPEMLFDRMSPSEGSEHNLAMLGTQLGGLPPAHPSSEDGGDYESDPNSASPGPNRSLSVSPNQGGHFQHFGTGVTPNAGAGQSTKVHGSRGDRRVTLGNRDNTSLLGTGTPSSSSPLPRGAPPGFSSSVSSTNTNANANVGGQQQQQQQQQHHHHHHQGHPTGGSGLVGATDHSAGIQAQPFDMQAQFYSYMHQMARAQQQRHQDHLQQVAMPGVHASYGTTPPPPLGMSRQYSAPNTAHSHSRFGGMHNQNLYSQHQQYETHLHLPHHGRAHSHFVPQPPSVHSQQNLSNVSNTANNNRSTSGAAGPGPGTGGNAAGTSNSSGGRAVTRSRGGSEAGAAWSRPVSPVPSMVCSSILAEHKHASRRPGVAELRGHILEFAKDSHGSRYLQEVMAAASESEREVLLDEVENDCLSVIQDLFGNYVMQNFLEHASPERRVKVAMRMKGVIVDLSMHPHGCRVVQKVLELLGPDEIRYELLEELIASHGDLERTAKDAHATHVLQKAVVVLQRDVFPFLEKRPGRGDRFRRRSGHRGKSNLQTSKPFLASTNPVHIELSKRLLKAVEDVVACNVMELAVNQHACRLVQRVLGDCDRGRAECIPIMMDALEADYTALSRDQHGNFILQHVLELGQQDQADRIQTYVSTRVVDLSQHKFGSHLVEKCLLTATPRQASVIIAALLASPATLLTKLMKDAYANFVLQRAFDVGTPVERNLIDNEVSQRAEMLSQTTSGRHILSHLSRSR
eukprot:CAMPEP_0184541458 /NCGR_PEP_ID=MMETSP0199_2-20130426/1382_1 /TAXON_ID=1112570 /ORGANISM="Thraustochytrium sp., Strain LLF1b" /LENGTH=1013 /DNA_ID=CAMNT_0026935179 /DNA_START=844 /DNA_END=3885 /DNA_ORIENTATION=+